MKTAIELIEQERTEQIEKHGFSIEKDAIYYKNGELLQAAAFCKEQAMKKLFGAKQEMVKWPACWDAYFEDKIRNKPVIDQLTVCGAFYLAELDRTGKGLHREQAIDISHLMCSLMDLK
jgi:hypothetical protein